MYADEWAECLHHLYCRTPHYLGEIDRKKIPFQIRNRGKDEGCEWIGDYSSGNSCEEDQVFRVEIVYEKTTRQINGFYVTRERISDGSHFGSQYGERSISSENKSAFYSAFRPLISKKKGRTKP